MKLSLFRISSLLIYYYPNMQPDMIDSMVDNATAASSSPVPAWALGQTTDLGKVKELMLTPIAGEITEREPYNGYLIFQGGIPEVEAFIRKFHK